jgi:hypothetical protein
LTELLIEGLAEELSFAKARGEIEVTSARAEPPTISVRSEVRFM